jgi:hypothetical protein
MTKAKVIERLCALCSEVGDAVYQHSYATDCFCGPDTTNFQFEEIILKYIEEAVKEKIDR